MVTVQAPSATVTALPVALEEGTGRYRTSLRCSEVRSVARALGISPKSGRCSGLGAPISGP